MADTETEELEEMDVADMGDDGLGDSDPDADDSFVQAGGDAKLLNQEEIDSLLGFDDHGDGDNQSGVMALINAALINYERLPMLDIVFDRLVRLLSTSLRNLTSDSVEVSLDQVSTVRFADYMNSIPLPAMLGVFKAEEWDNSGMMVIDSALIYSVVDVLLGGRKGTSAVRIEGRPYTTIEQKLIERMIGVTLGDLSTAFDPISPVTFSLERIETNPRFATITQGNNACVLVRMRIDMGDRGGRAEILIPYATLEPIREFLLQMFMGEKFGRDSIWETHLTKELFKTDVHLSAVLGEKVTTLGEVLSWKKGTRVMFNVEPEDRVEMRCGDFPMFKATAGQKKGYIAARIDSYLDPKKKEESES